jgi:hypothetical protein
MAKLVRRYTVEEKARLTATMKVVERWTKYERYLWERSHYGFRHFAASNITPIEHYRPPEPTVGFESFDVKPRSALRSSPPRSPPRKPAA